MSFNLNIFGCSNKLNQNTTLKLKLKCLRVFVQNQSLLNRNPHEIINHYHHHHHHPGGEDVEIDVEALDRLLNEYSLKQFDVVVINVHFYVTFVV